MALLMVVASSSNDRLFFRRRSNGRALRSRVALLTTKDHTAEMYSGGGDGKGRRGRGR